MSGEGFAGRWSRLKREGEAAPPAPPAEAPEVEQEISAVELAALPPVETLEPGADITGFLRRGVPRALRQAVLRRMWVLNPAIRDYVDPAREYALDWNAPGGVPGGGAVKPAEVAAMLGRLFSRPAEAEAPREAPEPEDIATPAPEAPEPGDSAPVASEPGDLAPEVAEPGDPPAEVAEPGDLAPEAPRPVAARRPRHGGATPD